MIAARRVALPVGVPAFALLLVAWGNATSILFGPTASLPGGSWEYALSGAALAAVSIAAARATGLSSREMGTAGPHVRGAASGVALGAAVAAIGVAALRIVAPAVVGQRVDYAPLATIGGADLARHIAVFVPLGIVIPEEVAFRGVLLGALTRSAALAVSVLFAGLAFAFWHAWIAVATVGQTTLAGPLWSLVGIAGALAVVGAGGAVLAWLRLRAGTIAATIAAHWAFNAVVLAGLWVTR